MKKTNIIVLLSFVTVIILGIVIWGIRQPEKLPLLISSSQPGGEQADVILYFGQECSHCQAVDRFISENNIEQKVIFDKKEIWHNAANKDDFQEKAKECALDISKTGVPFLFARGKCYVGKIEVEKFFKKEAGI